MKIKYFLIIALTTTFLACKNDKQTDALNTKNEAVVYELKISPIEHATMVLEYGDKTIYIDPTGGKDAFTNMPKADYVLITDIHSDHFNLNTLKALDLKAATVIAPELITTKLPDNIAEKIIKLNNGDVHNLKGISIEAIPMYNLREEALKYHSKGRGNGYVLTLGQERVYISGDTEDIPEMRNLKNIDKAFVCMNLPYTMTIESAANAVLEFKPKQIYPYHYRGTEGYSDVSLFKTLVNNQDKNIEVVQLNWYSNK